MVLGTICRLSKASAESLKIYGRMKKRLPFLVCPCSWNGRVVVVQDQLSDKHCVVSLQGNDKQMSVCAVEDLRPMR